MNIPFASLAPYISQIRSTLNLFLKVSQRSGLRPLPTIFEIGLFFSSSHGSWKLRYLHNSPTYTNAVVLNFWTSLQKEDAENFLLINVDAPTWIHAHRPKIRPVEWYKGKQLYIQSSLVNLYPAIVMLVEPATIFTLGNKAAFGTPVVPEVNI